MTVNEMIIEAITTDSRKRKCRYQAELEALGYKIIKDRSWYIKNPKTDRFIDLPYNENAIRTTNGYIKFGCVWSSKTCKYVNKPISVIDFEKFLNTPIKRDNDNWWNNKTNVEKMRDSLYNRKRCSKELNNALSEYQKKIDSITAEYQRMLKNAKDSYDWNLDYYTKGLDKANKEIDELLHKTA